MFPINRENLHSFCRTCLKEFGEQNPAYNIEDTANLSKWLEFASSNKEIITSDKYPRCVCHNCYIKTRIAYEFYEESICSVEAIKELLTEITEEQTLRNLQLFCCTCLNKLHLNSENVSIREDKYATDWMLKCFDQAINSNLNFPESICNWCYKKLRSFFELQKISKQSQKYLKNIIHTKETPKNYAEIETNAEETDKLKTYDETDTNEASAEKWMGDGSELINNFSTNNAVQHESTLEKQQLTQSYSPVVELNLETEKVKYSHDKISNEKQKYTTHTKHMKQITKRLNTEKESKTSPKKLITPDMVTLRTGIPVPSIEMAETIESNSNHKAITNLSNLSRGRKITCDQCEKIFYKEFFYLSHVKSVHEGLENPFQCTICQNSFRFYQYLKKHIKDMHANETIAATEIPAGVVDASPALSVNIEEGHKCLYCSKIFKHKEHLKQHTEVKHLQKLRFPCRYCEKSFPAGKSRRIHEMVHTGEQPFVCHKCNQSFQQSFLLKVDMNRHLENKELLCPKCCQLKSTHEELDAHIAMHEASQLYPCPKCDEVFKQKGDLADHDRSVHLQVQPFKCSFCELSFVMLRNCRTHEKLHQPVDANSNVCKICGKTFRQKRQLLKHICGNPRQNRQNYQQS